MTLELTLERMKLRVRTMKLGSQVDTMALNLTSDPHPFQAFFYVGTQLLKASHASGALSFCAIVGLRAMLWV